MCVSLDDTAQNPIDHIYITKDFTRTMEDVRTRREADLASDHYYLVVAEMKLKLKKHRTTGEIASKWFITAYVRHIFTDPMNSR